MEKTKIGLSLKEAREMALKISKEDIGVRIIVPHHSNHNQFLFVRNREDKRMGKRGGWGLPGGGVDKGETPYAAAMRELWEEAGFEKGDYHLSKKVFGYKKIGLFDTSRWFYVLIFSASLELSAELKNFKPDPDGDIVNRQWFNPETDFKIGFNGLCLKGSEEPVYADHVETIRKYMIGLLSKKIR